MIEEYFYNRKRFRFINRERHIQGKNTFTILVGKNGTGKSSLLGDITKEILRDVDSKYFLSINNFFYKKHEYIFKDNGKPSKVICVSTSPFDKFPVERNLDEIKQYSYLGLRGLHSLNFGISYLSKIIASLIESVSRDKRQANEIANVLDYLGYKDTIRVTFNIQSSRAQIEQFQSMETIDDFRRTKSINPIRSLNNRFFFNEIDEFDFDKFNHLKYVASLIHKFDLRRNYELIINRYGIESASGIDKSFHKELLFLIQSGIFRLRDVGLESKENASIFSIKNASSGEQSVILSILGIASQIKDNSLICIDEPEICLHPQWQERYIQILVQTFENYKNCQFLIATHSPHIISNLRNENCFILSMESGKLRNAEHYINHSIDFQLATIFETPGFKNEYLIRIALNMFSKVNKTKKFDKEDVLNFELLEKQSLVLDNNDPVYDIYISLKEMKSIYG